MIDKSVLPEIALRDPEGWQKSRQANTSAHGKAGMDYAELWARLMQKEIDSGRKLEDIADHTSNLADEEGITGFMYGCAVAILAQTWKYGSDLNRWHNSKYGRSDLEEGTVNPAVLTIS